MISLTTTTNGLLDANNFDPADRNPSCALLRLHDIQISHMPSNKTRSVSVARSASERADRRSVIAKALYQCISKQGYANTTLKDIADCAGMSPSHVGYYFDDRAAILECVALSLYEQIVEGFPDLGEPDLSKLADAIAIYCFGDGELNTTFLGVLQEISGLAVHDPRLREIITEYVTAWREYLEAFFERAKPTGGLTPHKAAWLAHAMLVGFEASTCFDPSSCRESAHELFRKTLSVLAGLEPKNRDMPSNGARASAMERTSGNQPKG